MQSKFKDLHFLRLGVYPYEYKVFKHFVTQKEYKIIGETCLVTECTFESSIIDYFSLVAPAPDIDLITKKHFNNLSTYMSLGELYR